MAPKVTSYLFAGVAVALLWWLDASQLGLAAEGESRLRVISSPAGFTVEAHGAGKEEVLREIGAQAGFAVVITKATRPALNVSIQDAPLGEVLLQLLRGENYAVVYGEPKGEKRQREEKIRKVLLLSPSTTAAANQAPESRQEENPQLSSQSQEVLTPVPGAEASLRDQSGVAVFGKEGWARIAEKYEKNAPSVSPTVADLLKVQASQVLQVGDEGQALLDGEQPSSENAAETAEVLPPGQTIRLSDFGEDAQRTVQRALALTQQAAQRDLTTLVEGLAGATDAAANSLANQETNSR